MKKANFKSYILDNLKFFITITILMLGITSIFISLGLWQYNRGLYKKKLNLNLKKITMNKPINLNNQEVIKDIIAKDKETIRFTKVKLSGKLMKNSFLLDNQILNKQVGYRVLTPLLENNTNNIFIIDRGFIAKNDNQSLSLLANEKNNINYQNNNEELPKNYKKWNNEETFEDKLEITGIINAPATGLLLKKDQIIENPSWPIVIQAIDYEIMEKQLNNKTVPFVIQSDPYNSFNFTYVKPGFGVSSEKHFSYALQWFTLALTAALYYLIFMLRKWRQFK